jgi:hypothetical protein
MMQDARPVMHCELMFYGISRDDAAPLISELARTVPRVTSREAGSPPAASPLFSEFAPLWILLTGVATVAGGAFFKGFFEELGKSSAHSLVTALKSAMQKAKPVTGGRAPYVLSLQIERQSSWVMFLWIDAPPDDVLGKSLQQIPHLFEAIPDEEFAEFIFDPKEHAWSAPQLASHEVKQLLAEALRRRRKENP